MRLFFASVPNSETRAQFAAAARTVELEDSSRRVPLDDLHMTLAFVGEVPKTRLRALQAIGALQRALAFAVRFGVVEHWPKPEVIVAAANLCPPALAELSLALHDQLLRQRLALKPKAFRPHVTIARKVSQAPVLPAMSEILWSVREFHLVRSDRSAAGAVYTVVDTWPLLDENVRHR